MAEDRMEAPIKRVAQDVSRYVAGGTRVPDTSGKTRPLAVITGQQAPAETAQMQKPIQFYLNQQPLDGLFTAHMPNVAEIVETVRATLTQPGYFDLQPHAELPVWVFHQKLFNFPAHDTPEDVVDITNPHGPSTLRVKRLPPAPLQEAESARVESSGPSDDPAVTLCSTRPHEDDPGRIVVEPFADQWQPTTLLRCALKRTSQEATEDQVMELVGIPQNERWYLDRLELLQDGRLPHDASVTLILEMEDPQTATQRREQLQEWVVARLNLTELSRPARPQPRAMTAEADSPFVATDTDPTEDTLRLIQMASLTNDGGYYLRMPNLQDSPRPDDKLHLLIVIGYPSPSSQAPRPTQVLPAAANAIGIMINGTPPEQGIPGVLRFEGMKHVQIEPYAPPGCVAIGLQRVMPWQARNPDVDDPDERAITSARGFAESVHLADVEVSQEIDGKDVVINHFVAKGQEQSTGESGEEWQEVPCRGDSGPPLFPMAPEARGEEPVPSVGGGVAAVALHLGQA